MTYINPRSKLLYHADRTHELQTTGKTSAPINVEIDLSNRCSHGCSWCHFAHTHTRGPLAGAPKPAGMLDCGDQMDYDLLRHILPDLGYAGVKSITWSGGGEPTLHPKFANAVKTAAAWNLPQGLYTNGGHIDDTRAALLKQHMTFVYVSLDECTAEAFQSSKGVNRFDHVIDGIHRLVMAPGKATIGVGFLLHAGNYREIYHMVELGKALQVDYIQFRPIINYDQASPSQRAGDAAWINEALPLLRQYANDPMVVVDMDRFTMYRDWVSHPYPVCYWASMQTVITPNGMMWSCVNKRGHSGALLGDLTKESFVEVWARAAGPCFVTDDCRLMCRGHLANLTLDDLMTEPAHVNFV